MVSFLLTSRGIDRTKVKISAPWSRKRKEFDLEKNSDPEGVFYR